MSRISLPSRRRFLRNSAVLGGAAWLHHVAAFPAERPAQRAPGRVLLVTGVDYPGHPWRETTPALVRHLTQGAAMTVAVTEDPHLLDSQALHTYDVVLLNFMNWEVPSPGPVARANLKRFVEGGKGLVLVHFACGAWQDWPEFKELAGRVYDPKLRPHDPRGPFTVTIRDHDHPITAGLGDFEVDDELYTCLAGEAPVRVLATARSKVDAKDYAMAFVLTPGRGRVFHSPLGHDAKALAPAAVGELFRRGTLWAAGRF